MHNQKEEEKLVIEYFRENYIDFPKGKLKQSESPDFILKINPKKAIGMELTQLVTGIEFIGDLNSLIEKKNEKISLYRSVHLTEIWLIVYADEALNDIKFSIQNKLKSIVVPSDFDRVFLFDLFSKKIYELD